MFLNEMMLGKMTAQNPSTHHAQVELLAERPAASPGQELWLGVRFTLEKDWHIYWINPGDSGQPPVFKWSLPQGFNVGTVQWPKPEKLQTSSLADYGYKDQVMLLVPIQVAPAPNSATASSKADIVLDAKWLVCREVCIPDHAQKRLSLPVSSSSAQGSQNLDHASLFAAARKLLPKPLPASWKAQATDSHDNFILAITAPKAIAKAEFFPLEAEQIENAAPQVAHPLPKGIRLTLKKSDQLLKPIASLKGLLVLPGGDAYQLEAPVAQASGR
ncbi:MAG TPA: protein-disulfide reductase DsbD domain-containing protein [Candidatus Angelobacter sp.]|nr:protein-disulfide reductase DsbD domain-containing protein [Candidatus Angelobacter sp.]